MGVRIRDADGDIWKPLWLGGWLEPESNTWLPDAATIELIFGPISEVEG